MMQESVKKLFFTAMSLFLVWQSQQWLTGLHSWRPTTIWGSLLTAWLLNLFVTGIFAFAGFAWPVERLLPGAYYLVRYPTRLRWWYEWLRVEWFRQALLATLWRSKAQRATHFNGKASGLAQLERQSRKAEFGHLLPFVLLLGVSGYLAYLGACLLAFFTLLINIVGNLYPVLLQRYHRLRLQRLRARYPAVGSGISRPE
jgi:hypothetical protein